MALTAARLKTYAKRMGIPLKVQGDKWTVLRDGVTTTDLTKVADFLHAMAVKYDQDGFAPTFARFDVARR